MTTTNPSRERIWKALFDCCMTGEPPTPCIVPLFAAIRHWCDRHDEDYETLEQLGWEAYSADCRKRPECTR